MADNLLRSEGRAQAPIADDPLTRRVDTGFVPMGRPGLSKVRGRLFPYDRHEGKMGPAVSIGVNLADRLSPEAAMEALTRVHRAHGMVDCLERDLYNHDRAMFICYAFNAASQIGPYERAGYFVGDPAGAGRSYFEYSTVQTILGVDLRRFFRAYANEVVDACHELYHNCDFEDPDMVELRQQMIQVADKRGISRHPWLIADCAEAATNVSPGEYAAVMASKQTVIGGTTNAVDRRNVAGPIRSMDNYDSSVGASVSKVNDIHSAPAAYYS